MAGSSAGVHALTDAAHACHLTAAVHSLVQIQPHLDAQFDTMSYKPTVFFNEFWQMRDNLIPVNSTLQEQVIALDLSQMGLWKFTIYLQVEKSFEMQVRGARPCSAASGARRGAAPRLCRVVPPMGCGTPCDACSKRVADREATPCLVFSHSCLLGCPFCQLYIKGLRFMVFSLDPKP